MQKVSLRSESTRSDLSCLGVIQCSRGPTQNYFVSLVRSSLFLYASKHFLSSLQRPCFMKETLRWTPVIIEISFRTISLFTKRSTSAGFPFLNDIFSCREVPLSKEFRRGELDGRVSSPFPLDCRFFSGSCFIPHLSPRQH